ncbi:MAG: hypothetical protein ACI8ZO_000401 [Flavobacteriales bacterium]|jgi:hypothetical protein
MKNLYSHLFKGAMFVAALCVSSPLLAGNEQRSGEAGATELLINPWARSSGFGGANSASIQGVEALFLNVAGSAFIEGTEVTFSHTKWLADIDLNSFGITQKVGDGALSLVVSSMNFGNIQRRTVEQPEGTLGTFAPSFLNIHVGYARKFTESIYGGVAVKIISESISDLTANGVAFDAGIQYVTGELKQIRFGIALKNVGAPMSYGGDGFSLRLTTPAGNHVQTFESRSDGFELPTLLNIGGSYDFNFDENQLRIVGNFVSNSFSKDIFQAGMQFSWKKMVMARVGYSYEKTDSNNDVRTTMFTGLAAGVSFETTEGFAIDYAYRASDPFGAISTLGIRFSVN